MIEPLFDSLRDHWRKTPGLKVLAPASPASIQGLQRLGGNALPSEFLAFLGFCNGFEDGVQGIDNNGFRFWQVSEMQLVSAYEDGRFSFNGASQFLIFADYLHWSWAYALELSMAGKLSQLGPQTVNLTKSLLVSWIF